MLIRHAKADVVVVGSGPAGAIAALSLARLGARVMLVDRMRFPRDKACGDLLSPRVLAEIARLNIDLAGSLDVGDLRLLGPTGRTVTLPWPRGGTMPSNASILPRLRFDDALRTAALEAGAEFINAHVSDVRLGEKGGVQGVLLADGRPIDADYVIGADGARSGIGKAAGLVSPQHQLFAFALRYHAAGTVDQPVIIYWCPEPGRAFPGYGWVFPGPQGRLNIGLGLSLGHDWSARTLASSAFPEFVKLLKRFDIASDVVLRPEDRRGGWLKMGLSGTVPARDRTFLIGDAAGLVNPLAGEGISGAVLSAQAVADAIGAGTGDAARRYVETIRRNHGHFQAVTAPFQVFMAGHTRVLALLGRVLTAPVLGPALSSGWSMYWNDLAQEAAPGAGKVVASSLDLLATASTSLSASRRRTRNALRAA